MNELLEVARAAKEYLRSREPMTGEVTALVVKLQVGIEEAAERQHGGVYFYKLKGVN